MKPAPWSVPQTERVEIRGAWNHIQRHAGETGESSLGIFGNTIIISFKIL